MKTIILRLYASQRTHLSDRDAKQFRSATVQQDGRTCGAKPFFTNLGLATQTPLPRSQHPWIPSSLARGFMKQERLAWAARA